MVESDAEALRTVGLDDGEILEVNQVSASSNYWVRTINGLGMLLQQGAKALEIWSGQAVPLDVMRAALKEAVHGR